MYSVQGVRLDLRRVIRRAARQGGQGPVRRLWRVGPHHRGAPMITREEADALLDRMSGPDGVGLRDVARAPDLARTVVALHDEADRLRDDARHEAETLRRLLNEAHELTMTTILERDRARDGLHKQCVTAAEAMTERDVLALELRRLRAAEAPGTDDAAVAPWTPSIETVIGSPLPVWTHPSGVGITAIWPGRWVTLDDRGGQWALALDAMRAAVPGSV